MDSSLIPKIARIGILGEHDGVVSDHKMQYVDFYHKTLYGKTTSPAGPPSQRKFLFDNAVKRNAFTKELKSQIISRNTSIKVDHFETKLQMHGKTRESSNEYNKIDNTLIDMIKAAVAKVAKKQYGYQWSPALS